MITEKEGYEAMLHMLKSYWGWVCKIKSLTGLSVLRSDLFN